MTTVYEPILSEGHELCQPIDWTHFRTIKSLVNGVPRLPDWEPIRVRIIHHDRGIDLCESDSPWLGEHALIFRAAASAKLANIVKEYGELLPVLCDEADLSIFNPLHVIPALDVEASQVRRIATGRIIGVDRYVFRPEVIAGKEVFKIPELGVSPTFVGDFFVDCWKSAGLRGLTFEQVWSSN